MGATGALPESAAAWVEVMNTTMFDVARRCMSVEGSRMSSSQKAATHRHVLVAALFLALATGAAPADVKGAPFPTVQVFTVAVVTLFAAALLGGLATWKNKQVESYAELAFERAGA